MHRYKAYNAAMATTAAQASVTTGTSIKTMLQLATPSTRQLTIISWGFSCDDPPGADAVIELLQTDVGATITQHVAAGIQPLDPNQPASQLLIATTAQTGFTSTSEGAITATRMFDAVSLSSVSGESPLTYSYQFMPDERPIVAISKFVRVRATTPTTAVDLRCWVCWDE
ncbi:hypothetical protein BX265_6196 [Streptomyces sp. TLI_235]|nr:hypothetical protein [Streptomyces sp. TLI_235]PBC71586.1 hypothetical protein BX265_6196 [Streptomyces sp. TLI_235]